MYKRMLIEQAFKFLHLRGQNLFVSAIGSNIRTCCCLVFEAVIGALMIMGMLQQLDDIYALLESITAFSTLIQVGSFFLIIAPIKLKQNSFICALDRNKSDTTCIA